MSLSDAKAAMEFLLSKAGMDPKWLGSVNEYGCDPQIEASISSIRSVAMVDEVRWEETGKDVGTGKEIVATTYGPRQFTFTLQVETDTVEPVCGVSWEFCENFRDNLGLPSVTEYLNDLNIAVVSIGDTNTVSAPAPGDEDRNVSRSVVEVVFSTTISIQDAPITFIEIAVVDLKMKNVNGTTNPTQTFEVESP